MTVAENIRKLRKEKGWTQSQLGSECGLSEAMIRQYELGLRNPKIETLSKIAKGLQVNPSDLMEFDELKHELIDLVYEITKTKEEIEENNPASVSEKKELLAKYLLEEQELHRKIEIAQLQKEEFLVSDILHKKEIKKAEKKEHELLQNYRKLNSDGQTEARKRVSELTEIKRYTEKEEPPSE